MHCLKERGLASADKAPHGLFDVIGRLQVMIRSKPRPRTPAQPCRIAFGDRARFSWTRNLITGTKRAQLEITSSTTASRTTLPAPLDCLHGGGSYDDAARTVVALNRL